MQFFKVMKGSLKIKDIISDRDNVFYQYVVFVKWFIIAAVMGSVIGAAGAVFHELLDKVTELRKENSLLMLAILPFGGLVIVWLYKISGMDNSGGTNSIMRGARGEEDVSVKTAPLIVVSTLITHLLGGSAGREGAALQLGGSLISPVKKLLKMDSDEYSTLIMCGMAAGFSALFGTPITAAIFAIEVTVVGIAQYSAIVPCIISAIAAAMTADAFGVHPTAFSVESVPPFGASSYTTVARIIILGVLCALISMLFCAVMEHTAELYKKFLPNPYVRVFVGGIIVAVISLVIYLLTGSFDYNGAGTDVIARAFAGDCRFEAFIVKIILTALTLGAGFKGGEIVPSMFIGSCFGCVFGELAGLDPSFAAAVGLVSVFCGVTNCPFAAMILSCELYGIGGIPYFMFSIGLSYMLSGYTGLYSAQKFYDNKFIYSKFKKISTYDEIKQDSENPDSNGKVDE